MPTEKPRLTITVSDEERRQIEEYWHRHKLKNQTQAILSLVRIGLDEVNRTDLENDKTVIADARIQLMAERFDQLDDADKANIYKIAGVLLEQEKYKQKKSLTLESSSMREKGRAVARGGVILEQEHPIDEDAFLRAIAESEPPEKV